MPLWGKTDKQESAPTFIKLKEDGTLAQDNSGKRLVLVDNLEATVPANKQLGITAPGWYLIHQNASTGRTKAELLIALSDAPRVDDGVIVDGGDATETDLGLENP